MSSLCAVPLALATTIAAKAAKVLGFLLTGCILHHYPVEGVHTVAASFNSNMPNPMHVGSWMSGESFGVGCHQT